VKPVFAVVPVVRYLNISARLLLNSAAAVNSSPFWMFVPLT